MTIKKQTCKKIIFFLLAVVMLVGIAQIPMFANIKAEAATEYKVGDIVEFGLYPQTLVTDQSVVDALNRIKTPSTSYGYYSNKVSGNWMFYDDVAYNGAIYRGVRIEKYRPYATNRTHSDPSDQEKNGYLKNTIYWFKFEPIKWRVLDPETGLVISEIILDAQPYNNVLNEMYNEHGVFASDYKTSSVRAWLHDGFGSTAFTKQQVEKMKLTVLDNSAATPSPITQINLDGAPTEDYIFLPSYKDVTNESYGFASDESRKATASDYAKCQGLHTRDSDGSDLGTYYWGLRGADGVPFNIATVTSSGSLLTRMVNDVFSAGVRPAIVVELSKITKEDSSIGTGSGSDTGAETDKDTDKDTTIDKETSAKKLSVSLSSMDVYHNVSKTINPIITVADGVEYTVSYKVGDTSVAKIDENNRVVGLKLGEKTTLTCTVTDEFGNKVEATAEIRVDYSYYQFVVLTIYELVMTLIKIIMTLI